MQAPVTADSATVTTSPDEPAEPEKAVVTRPRLDFGVLKRGCTYRMSVEACFPQRQASDVVLRQPSIANAAARVRKHALRDVRGTAEYWWSIDLVVAVPNPVDDVKPPPGSDDASAGEAGAASAATLSRQPKGATATRGKPVNPAFPRAAAASQREERPESVGEVKDDFALQCEGEWLGEFAGSARSNLLRLHKTPSLQ